MKALYFNIFAVFLFLHGNAQIKAGQVLLGGNVSYEYQRVNHNDGKYTFSLFSISPSAGIFVIDKLAAGLRVSLSNYHQRNMNGLTFDLKSRNTSFSPYAKYYFLKADRRQNIFIDGSFDYHTEKQLFNEIRHTEYGNGFYFRGGPVIFITSLIAVELALGYSKRKIEREKRSSFISTIGFQFHFGNN